LEPEQSRPHPVYQTIRRAVEKALRQEHTYSAPYRMHSGKLFT